MADRSLHIALPEGLKEKVKAAAKAQSKSPSAWCVSAILAALKTGGVKQAARWDCAQCGYTQTKAPEPGLVKHPRPDGLGNCFWSLKATVDA
jgi:ribosomal protein S27AE